MLESMGMQIFFKTEDICGDANSHAPAIYCMVPRYHAMHETDSSANLMLELLISWMLIQNLLSDNNGSLDQ